MIRKTCHLIIESLQMKQFSHLLIMGHFNYPKLDRTNWNSKGDLEGDALMESIRYSFLYQHVKGYTRTRESSEPSIIYLIFTHEDDMVDRTVHESPLERSDHCALFFQG